VDENLTGRENLSMFGQLYQMPKSIANTRGDELLTQFELMDAADRTVKTYSGGMRRRLDLASALIGRPRLLFLDEPTTGLDPRSRLGLWDVIRGLVKEGTTLLLTTQYLEEADELADMIAVVDHGKIIAHGTATELKSSVGGERIEVTVDHADQVAQASEIMARECGGEPHIEHDSRRITMPANEGAKQLIQVIRGLDEANIHVEDIGLRRPTLDDVFLTLTGRGADEVNGNGQTQPRSHE
jgi:ABC-2 type transport system ATP-binding protein